MLFGISSCTVDKSTVTHNSTATLRPASMAISTIAIPASSPISMPSLTPTLTVTLLPTLEPAEAQEFIKTLLYKPIDCAAPCFWGIVPGKTTLEEAFSVFTYLGVQLKYTNTLNKNKFYESKYEFSSGLSVSHLLAIQNDVVQNIMVYVHPGEPPNGTPRGWLAYSPETLINRYGSPSKVNLSLGRGPVTSFAMEMYFDEVNLIVRYSVLDIRSRLRICPLIDQFESIQVWMGKNPSVSPAEIVSIKDATGITVEELSRLMKGEPNKACFNLKVEMFP